MNMFCSISHLMLNAIDPRGRAEDPDRYLQPAPVRSSNASPLREDGVWHGGVASRLLDRVPQREIVYA
jgi:hypothetical protein